MAALKVAALPLFHGHGHTRSSPGLPDTTAAVGHALHALPVLFAAAVSRRALMGLPALSADHAGGLRRVAVNVWRNHALEPLLPALEAYAAFGRWQPVWHFGPYDDSLSLMPALAAALELVWLDRSRVRLDRDAGGGFVDWLGMRLRSLREQSASPIVLCTWADGEAESRALAALVAGLPGVHWADMAAACAEARTPLLDRRAASLAGTPVSATAQLLLARELACRWLPGAVLPPIKALALDLDHTLHAGVLGEDGVDGVQLTPAHASLQRMLRGLRERGVFLALVSRNEPADVRALFEQRSDYPLRWDDFSATEVSWGDKAGAIARIALQLRIAPEAVLYVDDNPGELLAVATGLPAVHQVPAAADAAVTERAVAHYPGLWRWAAGSDDAKRVVDLAMNAERERLAMEHKRHAGHTDPEAYFRELQVCLNIRVDDRSLLPRLGELARKTNQFNLSLSRMPESTMAERMVDPAAGVAAVSLSDRLADSGVVAVVVARREGGSLLVEELSISCRAMGRRMEDATVLNALRAMPIFAGCEQLVFEVAEGPRNTPARDWLAALLHLQSPLPAGRHALAAARVHEFAAPAAITIECPGRS